MAIRGQRRDHADVAGFAGAPGDRVATGCAAPPGDWLRGVSA
jgi:hypothetical protein